MQRTYVLLNPPTFAALEAKVIAAQAHHTPLEVHGIEVDGQAVGEVRNFSLHIYQIQPLPDDYAVRAQEASGGWASITVTPDGRVEMLVVE